MDIGGPGQNAGRMSETGMLTVDVPLERNGYTVWVGDGLLLTLADRLRPFLKSPRVAVVSDETVAGIYATSLLEKLREAGCEPELFTVPAGENSKRMEVVADVCNRMIAAGFDRKSLLIALGGGVVGDLAGFVAAIYYRGIPYVQVPTTVVSLVDSSVGGKTGVNAPGGKNLIGAFHHPEFVIADTATLMTLPDREFNEGFAEIIKHAAIRDPEMLEELRPGERTNLAPLIARNVGIKARVVAADERETTGERALLNFGHTIGHAIEQSAGYGRFLHGEAISLGLCAALALSVEKAGLTEADAERVREALEKFDLPVRLPDDLSTDAIIAAMGKDKKFEAGQIRFVLLEALGSAFVSQAVTLEDIRRVIENLR